MLEGRETGRLAHTFDFSPIHHTFIFNFLKLNLRIDIVNTLVYINQMLIEYTFEGIQFEWGRQKADINLQKHGISFETACEAFLDPFVQSIAVEEVDEELREAIIGYRDDDFFETFVRGLHH
jgi:hypothetical protein